MNQRLQEEIEQVRAKYQDLKQGEDPDWVLIPNFSLPKDFYNKEETNLLFIIPVGYPGTGPDNFFVDSDLRLKSGGMPSNFNIGTQSSNGTAPVEGSWGWFSWHPAQWSPAATMESGDNLLTFIKGVKMCLRGEGG